MRRRHAIALLCTAALPTVHASGRAPDEVASEWPTPRLHGQGAMRFFGLHVYDIRLWTSASALGAEDWPRTPLALEIEYGRSLVGRMIAERSLEEMARSGPIAPEQSQRWLSEMTRLFPDVKAGDRLTGVHRPGAGTRFFLNGRLRGEVRDTDFAQRFFGIWLGSTTSEPSLRSALLGSR
jgi:Chalcone isomerase-like